jgi:hypothetical protein
MTAIARMYHSAALLTLEGDILVTGKNCRCPLPAARCPLPAARCPLPAARCPLPEAAQRQGFFA